MIRTEAQKYLGVGQGTFNNFVIKYGIRSEKNGSRLYYNMEDLEKIKAELDERKRIAQPPVYTQFRRPDWRPEPRENYYDLVDICVMLDCTKSHAVNLINACGFKFSKFFTKIKKIYYIKSEIDENLISEIKKLGYTSKSKLYKRIHGESRNTGVKR
jgi:hypothetical protein